MVFVDGVETLAQNVHLRNANRPHSTMSLCPASTPGTQSNIAMDDCATHTRRVQGKTRTLPKTAMCELAISQHVFETNQSSHQLPDISLPFLFHSPLEKLKKHNNGFLQTPAPRLPLCPALQHPRRTSGLQRSSQRRSQYSRQYWPESRDSILLGIRFISAAYSNIDVVAASGHRYDYACISIM